MARTPSSAPFSDLVNLEVPGAGAEGERYVTGARRSLAGIALSGGGIRSATFNLGLLEGLASLGLLRGFDYLSTVSGGGYVGGFWTRWRSRGVRAPAFPERSGGVPCDDLRHLRQFSNFLTPRLGVFSVDTGRGVVAVVSGTLPALLAAVAVIAGAFGVWLLAAWLLLARPFDWSLRPAQAALSVLLFSAGTAGLLALMERSWRRRADEAPQRTYPLAAVLGTGAAAAALAVAGGVWGIRYWTYGVSPSLPLIGEGQPQVAWMYLLLPAVAWLAAAGVLVFLRLLWSRRMASLAERDARDAYDRVQARLFLCAGIWAALSALWILGAAAAQGFGFPKAGALPPGLAGTAAGAGALFAWARKRMKDSGPISAGAKWMARLGPLLPQLLAYVAVAAMAALVASIYVRAGLAGGTLAAAAVLGGALGYVALVAAFLNPDEVGLHAFYRSRLVRAYLGASNPEARVRSEEHERDDVRLDRLAGGMSRRNGDGPVHLVCCAANDFGIDRLFRNYQRGAVSAVLSPLAFSVDNEWAHWDGRDEVPTLGAAITASGAAFNSLMGARTLQYGPAVTFLATALNLRLGIWLRHPRHMTRWRARSAREALRAPEKQVGDAGVTSPPRARRAAPAFPGLRFFREMLGFARADGRGPVHLSDGGHFENTGVYELIRRHCTYILAADCGQDGDVAFDDLGNLVRKVREDFGVDVRIDLSRLRPGEDGRVRQHMVAGEVHYPSGETGILLVFKPTLAGSEPPDVQQYAARNAAFPHESTGDQFYDEAQWEAYRRLGEHAAKIAFGRLAPGLPEASRPRLAEAFSRARFEWLPAPSGFEERAARLSARMGELDALLRSVPCRPLLAEVWGELPDGTRAAIAAPPADAGEGWSDEALIASLEAVRAALRTAEEVFRAERLEHHASHPAYLGVVNYLARWAQAPTVRIWWPVLRTLHGAAFARFMERTFALPAAGAWGRLADGGAGFATRAWLLERALPEGDPARRVLSYETRVGLAGEPLQAGQLVCHVGDGVIAWTDADFFIPPGLWGCGFGTAFLDLLRTPDSTPFLDDAPGWLVVRIPLDPDANSEVRRRAANEVQMYRNAGFLEAMVRPGRVLHVADRASSEVSVHDLPAAWFRSPARWMLARRTPAGGDPLRARAVSAAALAG